MPTRTRSRVSHSRVNEQAHRTTGYVYSPDCLTTQSLFATNNIIYPFCGKSFFDVVIYKPVESLENKGRLYHVKWSENLVYYSVSAFRYY